MSTFAPVPPDPASSAGTTMRPTRKTGPSTVIAMNHFVRTRSSSSRLAMTSVSRIATLRDGRRLADLLDEDLVERRRDHLEPAQRDARAEQRREQPLRVDAVGELDLGVRDVARARRPLLGDQRAIGEHGLCLVLRGVVDPAERDQAIGGARALDVLELAVEHLLAARDDAHAV